MERICEISQIRSVRYLPVSFRRRKKQNLRTDDSLRGPGGASLPAANVPVVLPSSTRPTSRISLSGSSVSRVCNTPRKCARFLPLRIRRNVSTLLFGPTVALSSLAALCLFLFPPTPDAANCAHPDEILVPSAPRLALQLTSLSLSLSSPSPPSIHLPRKRRDRATRPLYSPERGGTTDSLYSPTALVLWRS